MRPASRVLFLAALALALSFSSAMIHEFTTTSNNNQLAPNQTSLLWTAMYSKTETPAGTTDPYVSVDLHITRDPSVTESNALGHAAVVIYDRVAMTNDVGYHDAANAKQVYYCCSQQLFDQKKCLDAQVGQLILKKSPYVHVYNIMFGGVADVVVRAKVNVTTTDYYFVQITNCGGAGLGTITLKGDARWMNPYGYLPGEVYALLPFMGILALGYIAVALYFGFLMFRYRGILLKIQWGILAVIIVGVIEVGSWYFYRLGINLNGHYSIVGLIIVVFINAVKKMVSRVLVLLVSMGVGTVKWAIGDSRNKLALLSMFYLFFAFLLQMVKEIEAMAKEDVVSSFVNLVIIVSAAVLDALFYYWIILSLIRTMQQLTLRRQQLKLDMYKAFFVVMAIAAVLSVLMVLFEAYLNFTKTVVSWQNQWISDAFWELLYYALMVAIAVLWRPRANNTRHFPISLYSYAEFFAGNEEDNTLADDDNTQVQLETLTVLGGGGDVTKKSRAREETDDGAPRSTTTSARKDFDDTRPPPSSKIDPAERVRQATAKLTAFEKDIMAFELPSDDEEEGGMSVESQLKKMD